MSEPRRIDVWVCDECDYWRDKQTSGLHQTSDPKNVNGPLVVHSLRKAEFVEVTKP